MNRYSLLAAAMTLSLASLPAATPARAATTSVQKCQSADGSIGYTDGNCAVFGNDAVMVSSQVVTTPSSDAVATGAMALAGTAPVTGAAAPGRRSPAAGCARTPTQLAMDLRASLAMGDVNRVAESYDWAGMSNAQGQRTLDRLQQLVGRPVLDSRFLDAGAGGAMFYASADAQAPVDAGAAGSLQLLLGNGDGGSALPIVFDVRRDSGCYFVSF